MKVRYLAFQILVASLFAVTCAQKQTPRWMFLNTVGFKAYSLQELIKGSQEIYLADVHQPNYTQTMQSPKIDILKAQLQIHKSFLSTLEKESSITIQFYPELPTPMENNSKVLLFLEKPDAAGRWSIVGYDSGYFTVRRQPNGMEMVENVQSNVGLWEQMWMLYRGDHRPKLDSLLVEYFQNIDGLSQTNAGIEAKKQMDYLLSRQAGPIPLPAFVAAVQLLVSSVH